MKAPELKYSNGTSISNWTLNDYQQFTEIQVKSFPANVTQANDTSPQCKVQQSPLAGIDLHAIYRPDN